MALNLLRKNNSVNIEAYHDAVMTYAMLGDGILDDVYSNCNATIEGNVVSIQPGIVVFGGRMVEVSRNSYEQLDISSFASNVTIYIKLRIVIASDDANSSCSIIASDSSGGLPHSGPIVEAGTYDLNLFTVMNKSSVKRVATLLSAGNAKNAKNLLANGRIGGVDISAIFLDDMSGVRYARNADVCAEARGFTGGEINIVDSDLYMPNRNVYLVTKSDSALGNFNLDVAQNSYVYGTLANSVVRLLNKKAKVPVVTIDGEIVPGLAKIIVEGGCRSGGVEDYPHTTYKNLLIGYDERYHLVFFRNNTKSAINLGANHNMYLYLFNI